MLLCMSSANIGPGCLTSIEMCYGREHGSLMNQPWKSCGWSAWILIVRHRTTTELMPMLTMLGARFREVWSMEQ
jgi:hypothetical protein